MRMKELNKIEAVSERDIDLLLLEEFNVSADFPRWFYQLCNPQAKNSTFCVGAWHSVTEPDLGESDLIAMYSDSHAILIENKIDAVAQPNQAKRYHLRGERGIEKDLWQSFTTCMIAPQLYLEKEKDSQGYDLTISYERIIEHFESYDDKRYSYRKYIIQEAIEQNRRGYQLIPDQKVSKFWLKYWELASVKYPQLGMRQPGLKPSKSSFVYFQPAELEKDFRLVHKMEHGSVDLQISGISSHLPEIEEGLADLDMLVVPVGKSIAIRFETPVISMASGFEKKRIPKSMKLGRIRGKKLSPHLNLRRSEMHP
jgi:hypothetical protein